MMNSNPNCSKCHSSNTAKIFWGYPSDVDEWKKAIDKGEIGFGGDVLSDNDPKWHCNSCLHRWGKRDEF